MPKEYTEERNKCYLSKKKANNGKLSHKDEMECKKFAAIHYFKKYGKSVQSADASLKDKDLPDEIDLKILEEQIEFFGSLEEYQNWQQTLENGEVDGD